MMILKDKMMKFLEIYSHSYTPHAYFIKVVPTNNMMLKILHA